MLLWRQDTCPTIEHTYCTLNPMDRIKTAYSMAKYVRMSLSGPDFTYIQVPVFHAPIRCIHTNANCQTLLKILLS